MVTPQGCGSLRLQTEQEEIVNTEGEKMGRKREEEKKRVRERERRVKVKNIFK